MKHKKNSRGLLAALGFTLIVSLFLSVQNASAQLELKVNDSINIKFGVLYQEQADWTQNPTNDTYAQNIFIRRLRFILKGQITPNLSFFFETDNPNLGKASGSPPTKTISSGFMTADAYLTWRIADPLMFDMGLFIIPACRNCATNAALLMPIDYGAYTYSSSVGIQGANGRDTGAQARGYLFGDHIEYRVGIFQGNRSAVNNPLRAAGRLQVDLLDPEVGFLYTGTYLGAGKVLALGAGYDIQKDYHTYATDLFLDHPLGPGSVTAELDYMIFDGGSVIPTLLKQHDWLTQAGYYISAVQVMPWFKVEEKRVDSDHTLNEERYQLGVSYFLLGHNVSLKGGYGRVHQEKTGSANLFTFQLQGYYL